MGYFSEPLGLIRNLTPKGVQQHRICRDMRVQAARHGLFVEYENVASQVAFFRRLGPGSHRLLFTAYYGLMIEEIRPTDEDFQAASDYIARNRESIPLTHTKMFHSSGGRICEGQHKGDIW
ncbi:hypothetical protein PXK56_18295 [Phaeobacter gallaeciensis]|uniref:hypothetical protein n=1 Tax=Phaeobacter gallaeciensis TaxID=60890 RepID=UPI0023803B45|nr:hypothetical protein [Phaeobacter gallaeciensis]MDE4297138.1 hypothetical protein [Phaeobacter gallaeciensis]